VRKGDRLVVENRAASANLAETAAFMDDLKRILVFSEAGGTGRSYHAELSARNRRLRVHYLLEPGWKADAAIQGLGRTNRTNQAQPPLFRWRNIRIDELLKKIPAITFDAEEVINGFGIEVSEGSVRTEPGQPANPRPVVGPPDGEIIRVTPIFLAPSPARDLFDGCPGGGNTRGDRCARPKKEDGVASVH
jgi:hypothetical protein